MLLVLDMLPGLDVLSAELVAACWVVVSLPAQGVRKLVAAPPEVLGVGWSEAGWTWWHVVCSVVREVEPGRLALAGSSGPVC